MSDELLRALNEVFPSEGITVPYIELKFRYAGKYGGEKLDELLESLVGQGIMTSYEFGGTKNYKTLKDLPMKFGVGSVPAGNGDMNSDLVKLLKALAEKTGDSEIINMANDFEAKYA